MAAYKIWLKGPDPQKTCCACAGKTNPCSSCSSCVGVAYNIGTSGYDYLPNYPTWVATDNGNYPLAPSGSILLTPRSEIDCFIAKNPIDEVTISENQISIGIQDSNFMRINCFGLSVKSGDILDINYSSNFSSTYNEYVSFITGTGHIWDPGLGRQDSNMARYTFGYYRYSGNYIGILNRSWTGTEKWATILEIDSPEYTVNEEIDDSTTIACYTSRYHASPQYVPVLNDMNNPGTQDEFFATNGVTYDSWFLYRSTFEAPSGWYLRLNDPAAPNNFYRISETNFNALVNPTIVASVDGQRYTHNWFCSPDNGGIFQYVNFGIVGQINPGPTDDPTFVTTTGAFYAAIPNEYKRNFKSTDERPLGTSYYYTGYPSVPCVSPFYYGYETDVQFHYDYYATTTWPSDGTYNVDNDNHLKVKFEKDVCINICVGAGGQADVSQSFSLFAGDPAGKLGPFRTSNYKANSINTFQKDAIGSGLPLWFWTGGSFIPSTRVDCPYSPLP